MIQIENLSKTYKTSAGGFTALSDVNLTVNDGEIFGIIGLSGAGKSTLVRCINFLEVPTSGKVVIDGDEMGTLSKKELLIKRRSIGMIFQGFNLLEQRTVLKNICFPLEIAKVPKEQAVKRARELLELVGLADKESSYPSQLSGGQKQRVAIARALAAETKYLLCDEATSALDPDTTRSILDLLKKVNKELGVTIIVITHEMKVIESICDRAAVLDGGNVAELAPVSELFANPKSDIARKLILPAVNTAEEIKGGRVIRIIFDGETSYKPVIANLILSCQAPLNILKADTQDVGGKAFGQIIIGLPDDEVLAERVTKYLDDNGIKFSETEAV
ncbi:MAG: ATP-binding cassette domain-containing protein [Oscillospiraceae bacterium]|nr:ATP-binding cassette domain-containing protein [Oscillospiraceae bacterium]MDD7279640.1 ATP-binding cassette domain-containing protein [Oscillospiraceae bacterium]MDY2862675.1 ATP-binding cassette domain-containing protein [Oscillospiraceae bacterium]